MIPTEHAFNLNDRERVLFKRTLRDNKQLTLTHHIALFAWCKLATWITSIEDADVVDLDYIRELRLMSDSLRLSPKKEQQKAAMTRLQQQYK